MARSVTGQTHGCAFRLPLSQFLKELVFSLSKKIQCGQFLAEEVRTVHGSKTSKKKIMNELSTTSNLGGQGTSSLTIPYKLTEENDLATPSTRLPTGQDYLYPTLIRNTEIFFLCSLQQLISTPSREYHFFYKGNKGTT